jgi:hypothetical protein
MVVDKKKRRTRIFLIGWLFVVWMVIVPQPTFTDEADVQIRTEIISLVEDTLSSSYSYSKTSTHQVPHFEVLDRIYPKWHHGKPAIGRQFWIDADYRAFFVLYRVDYVHIVNSVMTKVKGKKLIYWTKRDEAPKLDKFWPFQFWASLGQRSRRDNDYRESSYAIRFGMKITRNESLEWIISEEALYDEPNIENDIRDHCQYEKQLLDWGLKSDCDKPVLGL